jgi:hypothetical protein
MHPVNRADENKLVEIHFEYYRMRPEQNQI